MNRNTLLLFAAVFACGCVTNEGDTVAVTKQEVVTTRPTINPTTTSTTRPSNLTSSEANALSAAEKPIVSNPYTSTWGPAQSVTPSRNGGYIVNFGSGYVGPRNVWVHDSQVEIQSVK